MPELSATAEIVVRFTAPGFHSWPDATGGRSYLASPHRHTFHVAAHLAVTHDEREVEFHDFLDWCKREFGQGDFGHASCESLARRLLVAVMARHPDRHAAVSVFEDNEVGAVVARARP